MKLNEKPNNRMSESKTTKIIGAGVVISFGFFLLFGITNSELSLVFMIGLACVFGISFALSLAKDVKDNETVTAVSSPDNAVQGKITRIDPRRSNSHWLNSSPPRIYYICEVTRTYDDGKFAKQDEFEKLHKAEIWLEVNFDDELAKHFERIGDAANKLKQCNDFSRPAR